MSIGRYADRPQAPAAGGTTRSRPFSRVPFIYLTTECLSPEYTPIFFRSPDLVTLHVMAEVLAVVAGGAGLASLAIQLADGVDRLRKRCESLERLRHDIGNLIDDLKMMSLELHNLEIGHINILEFEVGPIILSRCRACCKNIPKRLETLITVIPIAPSRLSNRRALRILFKSKKWNIELEELRSAVTNLKLDIIL